MVTEVDVEAKGEALIEPFLASRGLQLVEVQYRQGGRHSLVRLFIHRPGGATVEDCARVSQHLSPLLDVNDFVHGPYSLEVSSPGLDRPLVTDRDFSIRIGETVQITRQSGEMVEGLLLAFDADTVTLKNSATSIAVPRSDISSARVGLEI